MGRIRSIVVPCHRRAGGRWRAGGFSANGGLSTKLGCSPLTCPHRRRADAVRRRQRVRLRTDRAPERTVKAAGGSRRVDRRRGGTRFVAAWRHGHLEHGTRSHGLPVHQDRRTPFAGLHRILRVLRAKGSFGYRVRGGSFELVAGSILVSHPGDEYVCTRPSRLRRMPVLRVRRGTDQGRSVIAPASGAPARYRRCPSSSCSASAQAAAEGGSDVRLDEAGLLLATRLVEVVSGRKYQPPGPDAGSPPCRGGGAVDVAHAQRRSSQRRKCGAQPVPLPAAVRPAFWA